MRPSRATSGTGQVGKLAMTFSATAWHIALQLQRAHQPLRKNKGKTILVFDDNKHGIANVADSIYDPPAWTDDYYERGKKQGALDQLIDTPFAVKSHHVGLVQIADLYAAIFRRYAELTDHSDPERYPGERRHIVEWVQLLVPRLVAKGSRWPVRSKSKCAQWYISVAPASLLALK